MTYLPYRAPGRASGRPIRRTDRRGVPNVALALVFGAAAAGSAVAMQPTAGAPTMTYDPGVRDMPPASIPEPSGAVVFGVAVCAAMLLRRAWR